MEKRNALVTGGARGIGAAVSMALAKDHCRVFINYLNSKESAEELAEVITKKGGEAYAVQADVRDSKQIENMIADIEDKFGGLEVLVSNANMSFTAKSFLDQTWDEFSEKLNNEIRASYLTGQLAAKSMREKGRGRLIFISSTLSERPAPGFIAHGTAKGALDSMNKYLAAELGSYGITSNIVAPGLVMTDSTKEAPEEFINMIKEATPMKKVGTPEDVANAVSFLAKDSSSHITGTYLPVCGGAVIA